MSRKVEYTLPGTFIQADAFTYPRLPPCDFLFLDPVYDPEIINTALAMFLYVAQSAACFMYPEQIREANFMYLRPFDQVAHWVKPVSTKNTSRRYSRFIEAILIWHRSDGYFNQDLHWSTRTGVFTDTIIGKHDHPFQKPDSLVEKLIRLHTPPGGTVLDPFCGSKVVKRVCDGLGFRSLSIDLIDYD